MIYDLIETLIQYGLNKELISRGDEPYFRNRLIEFLHLDVLKEGKVLDLSLEQLIDAFDNYAVEQGFINDTVTEKDNYDTALMSVLVDRPSAINKKFHELYNQGKRKATDYFYNLNVNSNYIRKYRIDRDLKWKVDTEYGALDITINLSKPEKDPRDIEKAKNMPKSAYPVCLLCRENEGYHGRIDHPARGNIRLIQMSLDGDPFCLQYSPYSYYNEHCIALSEIHKPMVINAETIRKLLDFLDFLPHYFIGSNADLPIVGGSILAHEHFQGGRYRFAMDDAKSIYEFSVKGFEGVKASIIKWPLSVIRLEGKNKKEIVSFYERVMDKWINYSDESVNIFAYTNNERHNTITPIARMHDGNYQLDLVLRNNLRTDEYPMGLYHSHPENHHIKKENIGLIEVMGLAVLPRRLKDEMAMLKDYLLNNKDYRQSEVLEKHADWADSIKQKYSIDSKNIDSIIDREIGLVFKDVLENCGVFKQNEEGLEAFIRFIKTL